MELKKDRLGWEEAWENRRILGCEEGWKNTKPKIRYKVKKWEPPVCWEAETHAHSPSIHKFVNESAKNAIKTTHY